MKKPYVAIPVTARPIPTANVPSGTAFLAASSDRCARCAIGSLLGGSIPRACAGPGTEVTGYPVTRRGAGSAASTIRREDHAEWGEARGYPDAHPPGCEHRPVAAPRRRGPDPP